MKRLMILAAFLALLATACRAEVLVGMDVEADGSGTMTMEVGVDEELKSLIELGGGSPGDLLGDLELNAPEGARSFERTEGDLTFYGAEIPFDDPAQVESLLTEGPAGQAMFQSFRLTVDEGAEVEATVSVPAAELGDLPIDPSELTGEFFSARFVLSLPGTVVESNADETLADGRLAWDLPITGGEKEIYAKSSTAGGSPAWLWFALAAVVVAAVAVGAVLISRSRRSERALDEDDAAAGLTPDEASTSTDVETPPAGDPGDASASDDDADDPTAG